jgi:hypothetical protein
MIALISVLAISACSSSASSTSTTSTAANANAAGSPSAVSIPQPQPLPSDEAGIVCADLNALVVAGNTADPISTAAGANRITIGQVIYAINNNCPDLKKLESDIGA